LELVSSNNHVATVVAGPDLPATGAFVSQVHCHFQWHEGSHVESHNLLVLFFRLMLGLPTRFDQNLDWIELNELIS
jgi:hypothetical protein